jgi:hypothetical protein
MSPVKGYRLRLIDAKDVRVIADFVDETVAERCKELLNEDQKSNRS